METKTIFEAERHVVRVLKLLEIRSRLSYEASYMYQHGHVSLSPRCFLIAQADIAAAKLRVDHELPNSSLYTFTGNLLLDGRTLPLNPNQVLLRGCMLRNTDSILGIVLFTGHETKVNVGG